jgi:chemotaxis protein methyltransferase CheR
MNDDEDFALFVKKIKDFTTIDLNQYKESQMRRRLTSLRTKKGFSTFSAFFEAIT